MITSNVYQCHPNTVKKRSLWMVKYDKPPSPCIHNVWLACIIFFLLCPWQCQGCKKQDVDSPLIPARPAPTVSTGIASTMVPLASVLASLLHTWPLMFFCCCRKMLLPEAFTHRCPFGTKFTGLCRPTTFLPTTTASIFTGEMMQQVILFRAHQGLQLK